MCSSDLILPSVSAFPRTHPNRSRQPGHRSRSSRCSPSPPAPQVNTGAALASIRSERSWFLRRFFLTSGARPWLGIGAVFLRSPLRRAAVWIEELPHFFLAFRAVAAVDSSSCLPCWSSSSCGAVPRRLGPVKPEALPVQRPPSGRLGQSIVQPAKKREKLRYLVQVGLWRRLFQEFQLSDNRFCC